MFSVFSVLAFSTTCAVNFVQATADSSRRNQRTNPTTYHCGARSPAQTRGDLRRGQLHTVSAVDGNPVGAIHTRLQASIFLPRGLVRRVKKIHAHKNEQVVALLRKKTNNDKNRQAEGGLLSRSRCSRPTHVVLTEREPHVEAAT